MQHTGPLNEKQKAQLEQFKLKVNDLLKPEYDDDFLLRWIRAREWDLDKAEKMLRESLAWREKNDIDNLLLWQIPEVLRKYHAGNYFGHDKEGYPIWYELLGFMDLPGLLLSVPKWDLLRYRLRAIEFLYKEIFPEYSKKFGKRINKVNEIFDMEGVGIKHIWQPGFDVFTKFTSILEANYPETLRTCYVINAPAILPIFYNVVKPFLAEYTRTKIRFLGHLPFLKPYFSGNGDGVIQTDCNFRGNWKEELLRNIDADQLPVHWGGTCSDPDGDPYCKSQIGIGGKIPESYYMKNRETNLDLSQFTTVTIKRSSSLQLEFIVVHDNSILGWNFWTHNHDIGFAVYRCSSESRKLEDMEEVVANSRVSSHFVPETGSVVCEKTGTYVVRFDNTYSWVNAKKLSYSINILLPDDDVTLETPTS